MVDVFCETGEDRAPKAECPGEHGATKRCLLRVSAQHLKGKAEHKNVSR